jgi:hypothetical protein
MLLRVLAVLLLTTLPWSGIDAQTFNPRACGGATVVTTGGAAVVALTGKVNGYYIVNPLSATDHGLGAVEPLYIDTTTTATTTASGTNAALAPGQPFGGIFGSNTNVSVNATTSGHNFTCVRW